MKKFAFVILAGIMVINCSFMKRIQVMSPSSEYKPFMINSLISDGPLIIEGPFIDEAINEQVYIVTSGYVRLHKQLWKKAYPQSKDAEGVTRSRLLIQYTDYPAKYKGEDVIFESAWKVRAELVNFVESMKGKWEI
ncbi:hypothetical protein JXB28_00425 [Candidatus Woesearchaeota archaeon]|nr:hypothetical protein [Candidatus Woesearchaeota archaeon]